MSNTVLTTLHATIGKGNGRRTDLDVAIFNAFAPVMVCCSTSPEFLDAKCYLDNYKQTPTINTPSDASRAERDAEVWTPRS